MIFENLPPSGSGCLDFSGEVTAAERKILDGLLKAGWIHSFQILENKRWQIKWKADGAQRVIFLKDIVATCHLLAHQRAPVEFTLLARGDYVSTLASATVPAAMFKFWKGCCDEIGLQAVEEDCAAFVKIIVLARTGFLNSSSS